MLGIVTTQEKELEGYRVLGIMGVGSVPSSGKSRKEKYKGDAVI